MSCIVLAGGKSKRLGRNKVTEKLGQTSLLETVVSRLSELETEIIVVTAHNSVIPGLSQYSNLKIVEDIYPEKGTLGGLYTGIFASAHFHSFAAACDMPFLNTRLIRHMLDLTAEYDAVVPRTNGGVLEPLHAIYSKRCLEPIEYLIKQNRLSVLKLYPMIKVKYLEETDIKTIDPYNLSFFNINTESDLASGREIYSKKESAE